MSHPMHQVKYVAKGKGQWFPMPSASGWKVVFHTEDGSFPCVCSSGQHTEENPGSYGNGRSLLEHLKGTSKSKVAGGEYVGQCVIIPYSVCLSFFS